MTNLSSVGLNARILVVDDSPAIHDDFRKILAGKHQPVPSEAEVILFKNSGQAAGPSRPIFEIESALQGESAVVMLRKAIEGGRPFSMAFVDMRMPPGWNGIETIKALWQVDPALQVVICTAFSDHSWEEITGDLGYSDNLLILKKPFDNIEVLQLAHALVRKRELDRQAKLKLGELEKLVEARTVDLRSTNETLVREMAERRRAEEDRLQMERKLLHAQKLESLGVVAAGVAHDFNNLLTGILGSLAVVRGELPSGGAGMESAHDIEKAARQAASLCRQMLAYSGRAQFLLDRVDVNGVIQECTPLLRISISKSVTLDFQLGTSLPTVLADAPQIRQVLMNLVINSSEAIGTRTGRIGVSTSVVHADRALLCEPGFEADLPEGDYVMVQVTDDGCGMAPETRAKIFDPFFTTKFTGRGLGLAAVLGIVRGHKGVLKVETRPGAGTTFRLLLPRAPLNAEFSMDADLSAASIASMSQRLNGMKILVIDDDDIVRLVTAKLLKAINAKAMMVADGRTGLEALQNSGMCFDVVLLDVTMPQMPGDEVYRRLRLIHPNLPVVVMTGFTEEDVVGRFRGQENVTFLQKPFDIRDICRALDTATRSRRI